MQVLTKLLFFTLYKSTAFFFWNETMAVTLTPNPDPPIRLCRKNSEAVALMSGGRPRFSLIYNDEVGKVVEYMVMR